jgi:tetratricopeptide (TPR) repeat protein
MRRMLLSLAILASWLATACPLGAGIYNLSPPSAIYPSEFVQATSRNPSTALDYLGELRASNDRAPNAEKPGSDSLRAAYLRQEAELKGKQKEGSLDPEDRVNLGACLLRRGQIVQATAVLEEAERAVPADAPCRCFLLANLASAYQENDDLLQRAIDTQQQALKIWPDQWPKWKPGEGLWYRRAETYALKLMLLRQAEQRNAAGRAGDFQTVDALFPRVRFLGPKGNYEAGLIDFAMWNELPFDAESIVLQLVFWRPFDDRLYWQYGELLNARGRTDFAYRILSDLFSNRQRTQQREIQQHYRILRAAQETPAESTNPMVADWGVWVDGPREQPNSAPPPSPATSNDVLPDWRLITVSFVAGMVVAVLTVLQWQQWRRRSAIGPRLSALGQKDSQEIADSR